MQSSSQKTHAMLRRRKALLGLGSAAAAVAWHQPIINRVVLPAHAQASVCPMIIVANVVFGPVSGTTTPPVCNTTFDILSGDPMTPLTIVSVTTGTLGADVTIDVQDLGPATDTTGPRVIWRGPATDAPFCSDLMPIDDVTFTVTATCGAAAGGEYSQDFLLSEILI